MKKDTISLIIAVASLISVLFAAALIAVDTHMENDRYAEEKLQWYNDIIKCVQGGTRLYSPRYKKYLQKGSDDWFNYKYCSFDGGNSWYAIDIYSENTPDGFPIIGEVEKVFPGFMENRNQIDKLYELFENAE